MDLDKAKSNMLGLFITKPKEEKESNATEENVQAEGAQAASAVPSVIASENKIMSDAEVLDLGRKLAAERDVFKYAEKQKTEAQERKEDKEIRKKLASRIRSNPDLVEKDDADDLGVYDDFFEEEKMNVWVKLTDADRVYCKRRAKMLFKNNVIGGTTYTDFFEWLIASDRKQLKKSHAEAAVHKEEANGDKV